MRKGWREWEQELVRRGLEPLLARELIWAGIHAGSLKIVTDAAMVEDQVLEGQVPDELLVAHVSQALSNCLVVTSPVSGVQDAVPATLRAFQLIVSAAVQSLDITSPYIDAHGVQKLAEPLRTAAERKVQIRLLTRETAAFQNSRSRGIDALTQLAGGQLQIRDYHTPAEGLAHCTSVHDKLVLADAKIGYVGSAEVRGNALEKNFELGAIIQDEAAAQAADAFETVWQVAIQVEMKGWLE